jgi:hypothetical protein
MKRIAADLSKQRPAVVVIVTPIPIQSAKEHRQISSNIVGRRCAQKVPKP